MENIVSRALQLPRLDVTGPSGGGDATVGTPTNSRLMRRKMLTTMAGHPPVLSSRPRQNQQMTRSSPRARSQADQIVWTGVTLLVIYLAGASHLGSD